MRLHRLDTRRRAAAQPGRSWTGRRPASPPASWPAAPSPTSRPRRASSSCSGHGDRRRCTPTAASWRADMPYLQLGPGAGPRHPAHARRRPGRHRRDRRRRVRRPGRRRRLPARLRLPGRSSGAGGPAARPERRGACGPRCGACAVLATSRVFAGLAHAERAQAAALRGDAAQAAEAMAEADRTHAPGMAVLYPWLEQARGCGRSPPRATCRARSRLLGELVGPAARATASPGTRCSPCTTWSGWAGPADGRPDLLRRRPAHRRAAPRRARRPVDGALPPLLARHARAAVTDRPATARGRRRARRRWSSTCTPPRPPPARSAGCAGSRSAAAADARAAPRRAARPLRPDPARRR